jgi:hypothetical protein
MSDIEITQPDQALSLTVTSTNPGISNLESGEIMASVTGGRVPFLIKTYKKNEEGDYVLKNTVETTETIQTFTGLNDGEYLVSVEDNASSGPLSSGKCKVEKEVRLYAVIIPEIKLIQPVSCSGYNDASLQVEAVGGIPENYTYSWFVVDEFGIETQIEGTGQLKEGLSAGKYRAKVADGIQQSPSPDFIITQPSEIEIFDNVFNHVSCFEGSNGEINIERITGGTAPYLFEWNTGFTGKRLKGLSTGEYIFNVTDSKGCTKNKTFTIVEPARAFTATMNTYSLPTDGNNGYISVNILKGWASNSTVYRIWKNAAGNVLAQGTLTSNTDLIEGLPYGTYTLEAIETYNDGIASTEGCKVVEEFTLRDPGDYFINIAKSGENMCYGDKGLTVTANASREGGSTKEFDFSWFKIEGPNRIPLQDHASENQLSNVGAGVYVVRAVEKDPGNPVGEKLEMELPFTIESPAELSIETTLTPPTCIDGTDGKIEINPMGGVAPYSVSWLDGGATNFIRDNLSIQPYQVIITDKNLCSKNFTIDLIPTIEGLMLSEVQKIDPSDYLAKDGIIDVHTSGGVAPYTYSWLNESGEEVKTTEDLRAGYGTYQLTVTDFLNCKATQEFSFNVPPLYIDLTIGNGVNCKNSTNGILNFFVDGGTPFETGNNYHITWYKWEDGDWASFDADKTELRNLSLGDYKVEVSDANTTRYKQVSLVPLSSLALELRKTDANCQGTLGSINTVVTGGIGNAAYLWMPGHETTASLDQLTGGTYNVTVTDEAGCIVSDWMVIAQSGELKNEPVIIEPDCADPTNGRGAITLNISGGSGNYSYEWSGATSNAPMADNLAAGNHQVRVIDNDFTSCYLISDFVLVEPNLPASIALLPESFALCNNQTQTISAETVLGNKYQWFDENIPTVATPEITIIKQGSYKLEMVEDGCKWVKTVEVGELSLDIDAEFLMPSNIYVDEEIVLINTSVEGADLVEWIISEPEKATILNSNDLSCELKFSAAGEYNVVLFVEKGECYEEFPKKIFVLDGARPKAVGVVTEPLLKSVIASPNPNKGVFNLEITVSEKTPLIINIFNSVTGYVIINDKVDKELATASGVDYKYNFDYQLLLTPGSYMIAVFAPSNETLTRKIVVYE